mmetsp:Transcript_44563/g.129585  ORF Transcript_44563/g.129585 Transcript_44563/m.129585 type:complete len:378 (+) Transcript_44563:117-1250(+)
MNKARAMLDALMGPGRDTIEKDKTSAKEKFKDKSVCKGYLIGLCPLDASLLGGRRSFSVCSRIHSEPMRDLFKAHKDVEALTLEYEQQSLQDLEFVVRECEGHIAQEKQRIRTDVRRKKPPLPPAVNDRLSAMKRESSAMVQKAEQMDDDQIREKEALITKANELMKERDELLEIETKKAMEALDPEEVCDICGTSYVGKDGDAAHLKFRIHDAYKQIRARIAELKPRVEELERKHREQKEEEFKRKRKEEWDKALEKEGGSSRNGEKKSKSRSQVRRQDGGKEKEKDKDAEKDDADKEKRDASEKGKDQDRERGKSKDKGRERDSRSRKRKSPSASRGKKRRASDRSRSGGRRGRDRERSRRERDSRSRSHRRRRR